MEFLDSNIAAYIEEKSSKEPQLLAELSRETHLKTLYPRMVSGGIQGRFLAMISHLLKPERVLEIGTFTGYSAICLSEGLAPNGRIITIEMMAELEFIIFPYLEKAGIKDKVDVHFGRAMDILPQLEDSFDLVFIDADKQNYLNYYNAILPKVRPGGIILADNVLWSGKITDESLGDKETTGLRAFNDYVSKDPAVEGVLLPLRDGVMMLRKL